MTWLTSRRDDPPPEAATGKKGLRLDACCLVVEGTLSPAASHVHGTWDPEACSDMTLWYGAAPAMSKRSISAALHVVSFHA